MLVPPYINPETAIDYSSYSSTFHSWTDVHRSLNPTDWGITSPEWDSRIDFSQSILGSLHSEFYNWRHNTCKFRIRSLLH